MTDGSYLVIT